MQVTREHLTFWITDILDHWKASTARNRYRSAYRFFGWLVDIGELENSPMSKIKPPKVEEFEVPVVPDDALHRLLKVTEGKGFCERRDTALLLAFVDTGLRVGEMTSLKTTMASDQDSSVDLVGGVLWVLGKGRRQRRVPLGRINHNQLRGDPSEAQCPLSSRLSTSSRTSLPRPAQEHLL
jgi:site-specific recombinase XerC